jgi:hypothetical protein
LEREEFASIPFLPSSLVYSKGTYGLLSHAAIVFRISIQYNCSLVFQNPGAIEHEKIWRMLENKMRKTIQCEEAVKQNTRRKKQSSGKNLATVQPN